MHSCSHAVKALAQLHQSQLMMQISVFHHKCLQHIVGHVSAASLTHNDIKSNYNNDLSTTVKGGKSPHAVESVSIY